MLELRTVLSRMLQTFDIKLSNQESPIEIKMFWIIEFVGLNVTFTSRAIDALEKQKSSGSRDAQ